jgi:hypothetical protein
MGFLRVDFDGNVLRNARPHPDPLPREEGESTSFFWQIARGWKQSPLDGVGGEIPRTIKQACQCFSLSWGLIITHILGSFLSRETAAIYR